MASWQEQYQSKKMTAVQAIQKIKPGDRIFIGTGCGQPQMLVEALVSEKNEIVDAEIYHLLTQGSAAYIGEEYAKKFRTCSFFLAPNVREGIARGRGDYVPIFLGEIPSLFRLGRIPLDVALIQTSPPDKNGNLSLGISVDIVKTAVENSLYIIAEVNEKMPRTMGESFISLDQAGVGKLVKMACELGRSTKPKIKLGICGEHGGDPASVIFCHNAGLDYVSCSPFRVPVARLAAAQAALNTQHDK